MVTIAVTEEQEEEEEEEQRGEDEINAKEHESSDRQLSQLRTRGVLWSTVQENIEDMKWFVLNVLETIEEDDLKVYTSMLLHLLLHYWSNLGMIL